MINIWVYGEITTKHTMVFAMHSVSTLPADGASTDV